MQTTGTTSSLILMFGTAGSNTLERGSVTVGAGSTTLILQRYLSAYVIDPGMGMQQVDE